MAEPPDDISTLIDSIRERTTSDLATSGAVAALNLIPYTRRGRSQSPR